MSIVELVVLFVLGLHPDWQPTYCDNIAMSKEICQAKQEEGYATAQLLAPIFVQESERAELGPTGPFWLASIAMKENSLSIGDHCIITVGKERLASTEELDPSPAGERRVRLCVNLADGRQSCRSALVLEETDGAFKINYCMAGEVGLFQLTRFEAEAGTVVPATDEELPGGFRARRDCLMDPTVNTSLAAAALARLQEHCCSDDQECREDWSGWVGAYNTGHCTGSRSSMYGDRIEQYYQKGMEYMCSQEPTSDLCPQPEQTDPVLAQ
jgi:hypothetical protein